MAATSITGNRIARIVGLLTAPVLAATVVLTQATASEPDVVFPVKAAVLEGVPHVRIDTTRDRVSRRELDATESAKSRLIITIRDGQFFQGDRFGRPLTVTTAGGFTYLSSTRPGRYIRVQRLNDTLDYIEHVDMASGSVTYWGELRVVLNK
jgi:hypothetical protein